MTKKKKKRRKRTVPILPIVGLAAGMAEPISNMISNPTADSIKGSLNHIALIYTGYNAIEGRFDPSALAKGLGPLVAGILAHKGLTMLGVNRVFGNLPSPLDKLRL